MPDTAPTTSRWRPQRALLTLVAALGLTLGGAIAQSTPLEALLPDTTVAAFYLGPTAGDLGVLADVWAEVGGDDAVATLVRAFMTLEGGSLAFDDADVDVLAMLVDELSLECPAVATAWTPATAEGLAGPSVLALSLSPFNPFPGAIALARPNDPAAAAALQDALIECFASDVRFEQDGVTLHVLGDGGDLPLVVARMDGTFVAATDPDLVRAAVRLANGSDEPSHLGTTLGREAAALMDGGVGVSVDFAGIAAGVRPLVGMVASSPDETALAERLLGSLASLGGAAGRLTIDADGLRYDGFFAPDASAGDAALAALIACDACTLGTTPRLPAGAVAVSGMHVDLAAGFAWLDALVREVGDLMGEPLDLRSLAAEAGLDLDALLLGWIGSDWHAVQLEPYGTDVRAWLTGPGTLASVSVRDDGAAGDALRTWRALLEGDGGLGDVLAELLFMVDPYGAGPTGAESAGLSVVERSYRGVGYERWRIGPTFDLGIAVHDGRLVLATPARSMEAYVDAALDGPTVADDPVLGGAIRALPNGVIGYAVSDVPRQLEALAELSDAFAAPLATIVGIALEAARWDAWGGWDDEWDEWSGWDDDWGGWSDDVSGLWRDPARYGGDLLGQVTVQSLTVPGFVRDDVTVDDLLPNGDLGLVFELQGLTPGTTVTIEMVDPERSWDMDTYLYLYDVGGGAIIADDDDSPDTNRSELRFEVVAGVRYAVVASSWSGGDQGPIQLETWVSDWGDGAEADPFGDAPVDDEPMADEPTTDEPMVDDAPAIDAPTFGELVAAFDVLTDGLRALATRTGLEVGVTVVDDGVRRTSWTLPLR